MRVFIGAGDSPLAPGSAGAPEVIGAVDRRSLLELVLNLAQIQYEMESRRRGGLSTDALSAAEGPLIEELHRRGVPIPQQATRAPTGRGRRRASPRFERS